ncbi:DUF5753 domain-containing protein [Streptomyces microflavus]|uniref:DUF5753 domain-containing protein n=1 Tax=Streptomyces microflavus TaxID=1919 RepID=UPI0033A1851F
MSVSTAGMVARQRFGAAIKDLRLHARAAEGSGAKIKQLDAARAIKRKTVDRVSRFERGEAWPESWELAALLKLYNSDLTNRVRLETMLGEGQAIQNAWWTAFEDEFPESLIQFIAYEDSARKITTCTGLTLPALLQTEGYAHALTRAQTGSTTDLVERSVELRLKRRGVFDKSQPPAVEALFSVGALQQLVGGKAVMEAQLESLIADAERGVSMRIVPHDASALPVYMFHILEFGGNDEKPIAAVDSMTGMTFRKTPKDAREVREFRRTFDVLRDAALSPELSLELIITMRKELTRAP